MVVFYLKFCFQMLFFDLIYFIQRIKTFGPDLTPYKEALDHFQQKKSNFIFCRLLKDSVT